MAKQVSVETQLRQALNKGANKQRSNMQLATAAVMETASQPLERTDELRGHISAVAASANTILGKLDAVYEQTAHIEGNASAKRMSGFFKVFEKASPVELAAAFDAKKQGITARTDEGTSNPAYVRLQEYKRCFMVWSNGGEKARNALIDANRPLTWKQRLTIASNIMENIRNARKKAILVNTFEAMETDEDGNPVEVTPEVHAEAVRQADEKIAAEKLKAQQDREANKAPEAKAKALVKAIMTKDAVHGEEWLTKFYNAIPPAIAAFKAAEVTAQAIKDEAERTSKARKAA